MIDLHLMLAGPEMLRAGHMLPKIPQPIPIICRPKPKTKEEMREMEGTNPENKSPDVANDDFSFVRILFVRFRYLHCGTASTAI
jgi:hypothetical protein